MAVTLIEDIVLYRDTEEYASLQANLEDLETKSSVVLTCSWHSSKLH